MKAHLWTAVLTGAVVLFAPASNGSVWAAPPQTSASPAAATAASATPASLPPGSLVPAATLTRLLPATVYFQGQTAPLQLRNAAAYKLTKENLTWVSLVDSSGYASDVQEKYQFYLVSEGPLQFGSATVPAGAYGGGFLGNRFLLMDLGGHTLAEGAVQSDAALQRPRPLALVPESAGHVRLYLGRRWVLLQPATEKSLK